MIWVKIGQNMNKNCLEIISISRSRDEMVSNLHGKACSYLPGSMSSELQFLLRHEDSWMWGVLHEGRSVESPEVVIQMRHKMKKEWNANCHDKKENRKQKNKMLTLRPGCLRGWREKRGERWEVWHLNSHPHVNPQTSHNVGNRT